MSLPPFLPRPKIFRYVWWEYEHLLRRLGGPVHLFNVDETFVLRHFRASRSGQWCLGAGAGGSRAEEDADVSSGSSSLTCWCSTFPGVHLFHSFCLATLVIHLVVFALLSHRGIVIEEFAIWQCFFRFVIVQNGGLNEGRGRHRNQMGQGSEGPSQRRHGKQQWQNDLESRFARSKQRGPLGRQ